MKDIEEVLGELIGEVAGIAGNQLLNYKQMEKSLGCTYRKYVEEIRNLDDWGSGLVRCEDCRLFSDDGEYETYCGKFDSPLGGRYGGGCTFGIRW